MICYSCKKNIKEHQIGIEKSFSFGFNQVGFFIICKECQQKLSLEEIKKLEESYAKQK